MEIKEIKDSLGRSIYVIDNASLKAEHEAMYTYIRNSYFKIGFQDTESIERLTNQYLHSEYSYNNYVDSGFKNILEKTELFDKIKDKDFRLNINLSTPSDSYFPHTHKNSWSIIYYANLDWRPEWGGETMFYNEDLSEIIYASVYKPGKLILFDGEIPHSIKTQSSLAPHYRLTVAMFINK